MYSQAAGTQSLHCRRAQMRAVLPEERKEAGHSAHRKLFACLAVGMTSIGLTILSNRIGQRAVAADTVAADKSAHT